MGTLAGNELKWGKLADAVRKMSPINLVLWTQISIELPK